MTDANRERLLVLVAIVLMCLTYGLTTEAPSKTHYDHALFQDTIEYEQDGLGYYDAYERAYEDRGVALSEIRSVRQPAMFVIWRFVPTDLLYPLFLGWVVAIGAVMLSMTEHPIVVLPVVSYFLLAGRIPSNPSVDQWLLVELWANLPLVIALACLRRGWHGRAAAAATVAVLIRELAVVLPVVALLVSWRRPRERAPWLISLAVSMGAFGLHAAAARDIIGDTGSEAVLIGTARFPDSVFEMASWMLPGPSILGAILLIIAAWHVVRSRRELLPALGLFALPAAGVIVSRPYWGFLFIPTVLLLVGDMVGERAPALRERFRRTVPIA